MQYLTPAEFLNLLRIVSTFQPEPVAIVSEQPDGPAVALPEYRDSMERSRMESVGQSGLFYDSSPTGSGKSTADIAAFKAAGRSLCVQPTHENCEEVVRDCLAAGIDAAALPGRFSAGPKQNCWNPSADIAERMGFNAVAAVCNAGCEFREQCAECGYLGNVETAMAARVGVVTHARAQRTGFVLLARGRDFISVHEDCLQILALQMVVSADGLLAAQAVLNRLLTDPTSLDRFGKAAKLDAHGEWIPDERRTERRSRQHAFCLHLADVVDQLIAQACEFETSAEVSIGDTLEEPSGVQPLLFAVCRGTGPSFIGKPDCWQLLLAVASGHFHSLGVVTNENSV